MKRFDAVVVGSGPAGGEVARGLNDAGKRVALVEKDGFGGVCPLRGCNPKKVLLSAPEAVHMARGLTGLGIAEPPRVDWPALASHRDSFVEPVSDQVENHYYEVGVEVFHGAARMTGPDALVVQGDDGQEEIGGEYVVLAPGMVPHRVDVPGADLLASSDDFLALDELPERIVFLGGGFVAMELAHVAALCGAEVTVLSRSRPLKRFDPTLVDELVESARHTGIDMTIGPTIQSCLRGAGGLMVKCDDGTEVACDMVVDCTGRVPDLAGLDLDAGQVAAGEAGIEVNEYLQSTTNPAVYSCGDAAESPFGLTPTATVEALAVVENILHGNGAVPNLEGVPEVCFTCPPIASAGLAVEAAQQLGVEHSLLEGSLADSFAWKRLGERFGGWRLVVSEDEDRILGAHLFGHAAEEMINMLAAFIRLRTPLSGLRTTIWAYPTCGYYLKKMLAP